MAAASPAERYRRHREAFTLALQLGCTPREAEAELKRRSTLARIARAKARLAAKLDPARMPASICLAEPEGPRRPWYKEEN